MRSVDEPLLCDCRVLAGLIRRWTIEQSFASQVGHIGSVLSIAELIAAIWAGAIRRTDRPYAGDSLILSKGHAALALYCALRWSGQLSLETFGTYCKNGSLLAAHPLHDLPGVEFSTGSLGQGLSVASGLAYGRRLKAETGRVYVLLSDGECNEGQVWEAAMFAGHHRLGNLTAVVDRNGSQCMGNTREILDRPDHFAAWEAMGWKPVDVDGHDISALLTAISRPPGDAPQVLIARTVLGKGVSFMERRFEWHYKNLSAQQAESALKELEENRASSPD